MEKKLNVFCILFYYSNCSNIPSQELIEYSTDNLRPYNYMYYPYFRHNVLNSGDLKRYYHTHVTPDAGYENSNLNANNTVFQMSHDKQNLAPIACSYQINDRFNIVTQKRNYPQTVCNNFSNSAILGCQNYNSAQGAFKNVPNINILPLSHNGNLTNTCNNGSIPHMLPFPYYSNPQVASNSEPIQNIFPLQYNGNHSIARNNEPIHDIIPFQEYNNLLSAPYNDQELLYTNIASPDNQQRELNCIEKMTNLPAFNQNKSPQKNAHNMVVNSTVKKVCEKNCNDADSKKSSTKIKVKNKCTQTNISRLLTKVEHKDVYTQTTMNKKK